MKTLTLSIDSLLEGYDAVSVLYPHVPSLSHWRAWEYAAYQNFSIVGRVLDLGCGDGRYFNLIWPDAKNVVGVDMEPVVAELGRNSGVYRDVYVTAAHNVPEPDASFDHVFANCSLEHMDHLDTVLAEIYRCLKPNGTLVGSVVTNRFVEWSLLSNLVAMAGHDKIAHSLQKDFLEYHHLANPLTIDEWTKSFERAGLAVEALVPILPRINSGIFLLMDSLWHLKRKSGGELGDIVYPFLSANANFPAAFRKVFEGLLDMETNWQDTCGAVFVIRKPGG
ncbi:methyltransferase type 11 [Caballeronia sordidicola]|uniref:Methyltransferase type 11 n=1 Tax=Caballeronia sordidicola TaxID=196367 RepID=A0A158I3E8_CABSO|nr:class I SAM-dependent methyltransferase [Caballeronia sordidicola]SAL51118.1 methyltransferase type 11 [Caballeronia sordidicola]